MKKILIVLLAITFILPAMAGQISYAASAVDSTISGKVVETMDSGGYTYVCLEKKGKKTWLAVPQTKVAKGKNMSFYPGSEMVNFKSKTLNRTFDRIIFSGGPVKN